MFVDRRQRFYNGDIILSILALKLQRQQSLSQHTVVITPLSNGGLADYFEQHQIQIRKVSNGDKYITEALLTHDLTLGGEEIGHMIIHTDANRVTGDGLRTALFVLAELASSSDTMLCDLAPGLHRWPQIKVSVELGRRTTQKAEDIPGLVELMDKTRASIPDLSRIECRPASTEPVYRLILEACVTPTGVLVQHASRLAAHIQLFFGCSDKPVQIIDCVNGGIL